MNPPELPVRVTRRIKRIAPLQLGVMLAVLYGIISIIIIPFLMLALAMPAAAGRRPTGMMALGMGFVIVLPFIYAALGFVFGVISAAIYNLVAKWIGGIEVEVE